MNRSQAGEIWYGIWLTMLPNLITATVYRSEMFPSALFNDLSLHLQQVSVYMMLTDTAVHFQLIN